jgi:nucleoside-diphosphate-sugar epimerase
MAIAGKISAETVLVTGSAGYIGTHLRKLIPFVGLDSQAILKTEQSSLDQFDPQNPQYSDVRCVVHLADLKLHEISKDNLRENIERHRNFISRVAHLPKLEKIIFSSSCSVYGYSDQVISEKSPVLPTSFYAESKLAVEMLLASSGIPSQVFRFGTAHGWSEKMRDDLFINQLAKAVVYEDEIEIYSPEAWRPYIHCQDFAKQLALAVTSSGAGIKNIVSENLTKKQILDSASLKERLRYKFGGKPDVRNYRVSQHSDNSSAILFEQSLNEMIEKYTHGKT